MNTLALQAAQHACQGQLHPSGCLYMVATPIGNLADISLRALYVLGLVDCVACEDTRHSGQLLHSFGLHKPLLAVHQHNEREAAQQVIAKLQQGERVAYISDAGTPAISDPGSRLAADVAAAGLRVMPLPGASSMTALISAAGCAEPSHAANAGAFVFVGFLPSKGKERHSAVQAMQAEARAQLLLEAPHRIVQLGDELAAFNDRRVTIGRELTKQFEHISTHAAAALPAWFAAKPEHSKGEFAVLIHAAPNAPSSADVVNDKDLKTLRLLLAHLPLKTAVNLCAQIGQTPRNVLYEAALREKAGAG